MFQVENTEGFTVTNIEGFTDPDVPPCPRSKSSNTESCGSNISDNYLNDFNKLKRDNYVLKTKIVTPVCPKNPYDAGSELNTDNTGTGNSGTGNSGTGISGTGISGTGSTGTGSIGSNNMGSGIEIERERQKERERDEEREKEREKERERDKEREKEWEKERERDKERYKQDNSNRGKDVSSNIVSNMLPINTRNNEMNKSTNNPSDKTSDKPTQANFFNSNTMMANNSLLSTPEKKTEPEPAKAEDKKSTPEDLSKCPPCPACERCPEPTVDCKKVINYKDKSYPVPVISDFSQFSRF